MQLDKLQAELRPRGAFEAVDLGFAMVRRWWRPVYLAWLVAVAPWFVLVWALLYESPFWAFFVLWWLKPLFDRVPLQVLSHALFGETPTLGQVLRALPGLWWRHSLLALLLYRLDPTRSFFQPVLQLEGIYGSLRSKRRYSLLRNMGGAASWLTVACLFLELTIDLGLFGLFVVMLPDQPEFTFEILSESILDGTAPWWVMAAIPIISFLGLTAVEPLYVGGGFALYLNRRTRLEGWDIELVFRRLAERLRGGADTTGRVALILLTSGLLLALSASSPSEAWGQDSSIQEAPDRGATQADPQASMAPDPPVAPDQVASRPSALLESGPEPEGVVAEVMARPEFQHRRLQKVWQPRNRGESDLGNEDWRLPAFLEPLAQLLSMGVEGLLWVVVGIALAGLLLLIVSRFRGEAARDRGPRREPLSSPRVGLDDDLNQPLPANVPDAAWRLWSEGRHDVALALLYRGALVHLIDVRGLVIEEGATEGDCLRSVRREAPRELSDFFRALTAAWQEVAYAHRVPASDRVRQLCAEWPSHFGGTA